MRLTAYAKLMGVTPLTARRWFHAGQIEGAYQLPTGTIIVPDPPAPQAEPKENGITVIYARVSNSNRRLTDLEYQATRMAEFANAKGWTVDKIIKEVGSGLNDKRPKLISLLKSEEPIKRIIVEHRDRLTRFGFNYLELLAETQGFEIIVANATMDNDTDDLMTDFTAIITSFCARLYGKRRGKAKKAALVGELNVSD